jgi:16S rRNA A1518/A1519 N6-dimethyltransferase RsmA/KsgA/DIM1 with predicted DNA glycosylase/AP lyase activity
MGFSSGVIPKRSLGQNFFVNEELIKKITALILETKPRHITEIGAGKGAFTKEFYKTTTDLTLIEKDSILAQILENKFSDATVYNVDFMNFKLSNPETTYFGSLPFNIANDIIKKIIKSYTFNNPAFFIIQKEVAEKYENRNKNPLGLIREIYADFQILFDIKAGNLKPRPHVTSSFVKFIPHQKFEDIDKEALEKLIKESFKFPRKTINNNLRSLSYKIPDEIKQRRPEDLELIDYVSILKHS